MDFPITDLMDEQACYAQLVRNFLRPFRGVNNVYISQYVAMFEWGYNVKRVTGAFVSALWGVRSATICPT